MLRPLVHFRSAGGELALGAPTGSDAIRAILLDIEGTTTPINFVYETLFPYARTRLNRFLLEHGNKADVRVDIENLRAQHRTDSSENLDPPRWMDGSPILELGAAAAYGLWLMDRDSKCGALKSLQGKMWQDGYRKRELRGEVYPDVPPAFTRWSQQGKIICIYSSGSVLAQKLLFSTTQAGDLTAFLRAHFDTTIGPKNAAGSYTQIAKALALEPGSILFISDVAKELDAAHAAGNCTALCVRTGSPEPAASAHRIIHSFDEV